MDYFTTKEDLQKTIEEYGVAIIPSVLTTEECFNMVSGIWDYFEHISKNWEIPINRNNSDTLRGIYNLFPLHSMLFQYFNVGHAQVSWDIRQNLKIIEIVVFQTVYYLPCLRNHQIKLHKWLRICRIMMTDY